MLKRRKENDPLLTKLPGGYLREEINPIDEMSQKILKDVGITFNRKFLFPLGQVPGHSEITTPISLYYATCWWLDTEKIGSGFTIKIVSLTEAVEMAYRGELENASSFTAIMRLFYLQQTGKLEV